MTNGSERIPEATDYKTLVENARQVRLSAYGRAIVDDLADAVESLLADIDARFEHSDHQSAKYYRRMRVAERVAEMNGAQRDEALQVLGEVRAERDALQAKLDAMRTEERWLRLAADARGKIIPARLLKEQRLVSEWTVVEGEQP